MIGNETGAVHIASALSTPSVCVVGGGHYGRFLPYKPEKKDGKHRQEIAISEMNCFGCNWFCSHQKSLESAYPCIANVSVGSVWEKVVRILKDARTIE